MPSSRIATLMTPTALDRIATRQELHRAPRPLSALRLTVPHNRHVSTGGRGRGRNRTATNQDGYTMLPADVSGKLLDSDTDETPLLQPDLLPAELPFNAKPLPYIVFLKSHVMTCVVHDLPSQPPRQSPPPLKRHSENKDNPQEQAKPPRQLIIIPFSLFAVEDSINPTFYANPVQVTATSGYCQHLLQKQSLSTF
ncbi:hypothetical protein BASA50_003796 [Batrachochytrium salamandrivorans]|uniref:Uncharacterized protein n=1 Tax=Batrachochytrium salamandrivorans TaxID=1357716 RepID=A0ABQ8FHH6_9FUNG|nr:hypothetical protein BASA50_003796 [Batrachochytrium salamandrivorans]